MIHYRIGTDDPATHLFRVTVTVAHPAARQRLELPVWIPGSYLVREFARHLSGLAAHQGGVARPVRQLDKTTWVVDCTGDAPLEVDYRVHALDRSVRGAYLDADRGFFNGTSVFLRIEGHTDAPHRLQIGALPAAWRIATAMSPLEIDASGRGVYRAADYDELVDHPFELGRFDAIDFEVHGVPHRLTVTGAWPDFDGARLAADAARLCAAVADFWQGGDALAGAGSGSVVPRGALPFERYLFLLRAGDDGTGGLEHRASTALGAARRDLPQRGHAETSDGYANVLGLIVHEYFHAWNVKRLRPDAPAAIDYRHENHSELLWFFEGHTAYYELMFLVRTGLVDAARFLRLLARELSGVLASPGRQVQSVAQASFDAWTKYYRSDENTPNATVNYYAKGALVALAFDLTLRGESGASLDDVMRHLWRATGGGPIGEADIAAALQHVGGRSLAAELAAWVHGTDELPLEPLFAAFGIAVVPEPGTLAQQLGLRVAESPLTGIKATHVMRGGAAEEAGLAPGDELIGIDGWRLRRLDEARRIAAPGAASTLLVARDQRLLELRLALPGPSGDAAGGVALQFDPHAAEPARALQKAWLAG